MSSIFVTPVLLSIGSVDHKYPRARRVTQHYPRRLSKIDLTNPLPARDTSTYNTSVLYVRMCLSCLLSDYSITVLIIDLRFDVAMWRSFLFSVSILLVYFISHVLYVCTSMYVVTYLVCMW